ncbi:MAG: hypothetical protein GWN87_28630 [Desulfuromonadales bacterium]|nr:hypothetical protein [Desulfuromonadales bacterium]
MRYLGKLRRRPLIAEVDGPIDIQAGSAAALFGSGEKVGSAVAVDCVSLGGSTTLFLVARCHEGQPVDTIEIGENRLAMREVNQAWATT